MADTPANKSSLPAQPPRGKRTDAATGRAASGREMHLQVWVNRRQELLSKTLLQALPGMPADAQVVWVSPLESERFGKYKEGAFLTALGLGEHVAALQEFWPRGGPVWDGLARVTRPGHPDAIVLIEVLTYPTEVLRKPCPAGPESRPTIEATLDATARWLGVKRPASWMEGLYQTATRLAHVFFLREALGIDAFLVTLNIVGDKRKPTTHQEWDKAKDVFRRQLGIDHVATPWLIDVPLLASPWED